MALKAIHLDRILRYVSDLDPAKGTDREEKDATKFLLGALPSRVDAAIRDGVVTYRQDGDDQQVAGFHPNEATYLRVQFGLKGLENFLDQDGSQVKFETIQKQVGGTTYVVVAPKILDQLGTDVIRELADEVEKLSTPTGEELKA